MDLTIMILIFIVPVLIMLVSATVLDLATKQTTKLIAVGSMLDSIFIPAMVLFGMSKYYMGIVYMVPVFILTNAYIVHLYKIHKYKEATTDEN